MRASRFLLVCMLGWLGFTSSANAALLGGCSFLGGAGCGPDFNVLSLNIGYVYDGVSQGVLTVSGATSDGSFLPDQLNPWPNESDMTVATNPDVSISVANATVSGNKNFLMTMTVDSSGNLLDGSITMNGNVRSVFTSSNNTNPDFQTAGFYTAEANGVALDGALIAAGSTITAMGFQNNSLEFFAALDPGSVLSMAGFGGMGQGRLGVSNPDTVSGLIEWDTSWTSTGPSPSLGVAVVPLPAAFWLFLSGIGVLISASKSRLISA